MTREINETLDKPKSVRMRRKKENINIYLTTSSCFFTPNFRNARSDLQVTVFVLCRLTNRTFLGHLIFLQIRNDE